MPSSRARVPSAARLLGAVLVTGSLLLACASTPTDRSARPSSEGVPEPAASGPDPTGCVPAVPLVDAEATEPARCVATTLEEWRDTGRLGVGQQLNVSSRGYLQPLRSLRPQRVALVGFDLAELAAGESFGFPRPPMDALLDLAADGVLLTASWHAPNPATGLDSRDRSWQDLAALADESTPQGRVFWADFDRVLELLRRLQTGDDGRYPPAAVVFRPLHEANGDWFWWGRGADPAAYRALWTAMQERAADAGVHNLVWAYSANARTHEGIDDPVTRLPERVDLAGVDSYDQVTDGGPPAVDLTGLAELAERVPRVAVTEVGPHGSADGAWDPRLVARTAVAAGLRPAYALFWFDDGDGADGWSGRKQLASLRGGSEWLAGCTAGVCTLPPPG